MPDPDPFGYAIRVAIAEYVAERHTQLLADAESYTVRYPYAESNGYRYAYGYAFARTFGLTHAESNTFAERVARAYADATYPDPTAYGRGE